MTDYGRVFGEEVAQGLGLGQPTPVVQTPEDYETNPADAFTRMAEYFQPPGGGIPVPFARVVVLDPSTPHAGEPRPA